MDSEARTANPGFISIIRNLLINIINWIFTKTLGSLINEIHKISAEK